jgi:opacity protein-like surface antigen
LIGFFHITFHLTASYKVQNKFQRVLVIPKKLPGGGLMKKCGLTLMVVGILICLALPAFANDKEGAYIGIGGSYALQNFQIGDSSSFDNAAGFSIKAGSKQSKSSATELVFDYFPEFKWTHPNYWTSGSGIVSDKIRVFSVMLAQKFSIPNDTIRPYLIAGIGYMSVKSDSGSADATGFCYKGGLGIDYFVTGNISLGLEGNYVLRAGSDVKYGNLTAGAAYHF